MNNTLSKRPIYFVIIGATLGLFFVIYWMSRDTVPYDTVPVEVMTNNIISTPETLPIVCTQTLRLLDCLTSNPSISGDTQGITQHYQKLVSERNLITNITTLTSTCTNQYRYIQSLQDTGYQNIIHTCSQ